MVQWLEDLLQESAERENRLMQEFDRLKADQALAAIAKLEADMVGVNSLADEEIKLIEQYRKTELERLGKKLNWLVLNLEGFIRKHNEETGEKSIRLPHGSIGLRKSRDRVEISSYELFAKIADRHGLWRVSPEKKEPDLQAVSAYIKLNNHVPAGVTVIPGSTNFSYSTNGGSNGESKSSETGDTV